VDPSYCERPLPAAVRIGLDTASGAGFTLSCSEATGRLLATLAASRPDAAVGESGTGYGVGAAWLASGLAPLGPVVTVEADPTRAAAARAVHAGDPRIQVVDGDWSLLARWAPFDIFFCDGGGKRTDPDAVIDMVAPGGWLVLDNFTPSSQWPPRYQGEIDDLRLHYLCSPEVVAAEVLVSAEEACIIATRRLC
jgi:predicted O-methyltransferase YrrM